MARCTARTKAGKQCLHEALPGMSKCGMHNRKVALKRKGKGKGKVARATRPSAHAKGRGSRASRRSRASRASRK